MRAGRVSESQVFENFDWKGRSIFVFGEQNMIGRSYVVNGYVDGESCSGERRSLLTYVRDGDSEGAGIYLCQEKSDVWKDEVVLVNTTLTMTRCPTDFEEKGIFYGKTGRIIRSCVMNEIAGGEPRPVEITENENPDLVDYNFTVEVNDTQDNESVETWNISGNETSEVEPPAPQNDWLWPIIALVVFLILIALAFF
jgi:hypothetical protein